MAIMAFASVAVDPLGPSLWQYSITLHDTGTTPIGTFWFSWVPGEGFLASLPSSIESPAGWTDMQTNGPPPGDGYSIQWVASSPASALMPSASLKGFSFESSEAPSSVFGDSVIHPGTPVSTSTVYSGAPLVGPEFIFAATPVPEPSAWAMLLVGFVALGFLGFRRNRAQRSA